jgi:hypothetical protein
MTICKGITTRGNRCTNSSTSIIGYCKRHKSQYQDFLFADNSSDEGGIKRFYFRLFDDYQRNPLGWCWGKFFSAAKETKKRSMLAWAKGLYDLNAICKQRTHYKLCMRELAFHPRFVSERIQQFDDIEDFFESMGY